MDLMIDIARRAGRIRRVGAGHVSLQLNSTPPLITIEIWLMIIDNDINAMDCENTLQEMAPAQWKVSSEVKFGFQKEWLEQFDRHLNSIDEILVSAAYNYE
ncbi:hypothetical protein TNCV_3661711 [Trichonephila clavipes]|nr:hypothetical protein TNCV_3661711 [Trichonephila clavipes]